MEQENVARFKGMPLANVDVGMEVDESDIDGAAADEAEGNESGEESVQEETVSIQEQMESIQEQTESIQEQTDSIQEEMLSIQEQVEKMRSARKRRKISGKQVESDKSDQEQQKKRPTRRTRKKYVQPPASETESDQFQFESGNSDEEWSAQKKKITSARHDVHPLEKRKEPAHRRDHLTFIQLEAVKKYFLEQIDSCEVLRKLQCEKFLKKITTVGWQIMGKNQVYREK